MVANRNVRRVRFSCPDLAIWDYFLGHSFYLCVILFRIAVRHCVANLFLTPDLVNPSPTVTATDGALTQTAIGSLQELEMAAA